jgi:hypothetical protein
LLPNGGVSPARWGEGPPPAPPSSLARARPSLQPEGEWEQGGECRIEARSAVASLGHEHHGEVLRELGQHLPTDAARRSWRPAAGDHSACDGARLARRDHLRDRVSLRAQARAIGRVLDVASGEDLAGGRLDRGPYGIAGVRRVGALSRAACSIDESIDSDSIPCRIVARSRRGLQEGTALRAPTFTIQPDTSETSASRRLRATSSTSA